MAINVNVANIQANQLLEYASKLRNCRTQLVNYKSSVSTNWQGKEVYYITCAIDQVIAQIDNEINQLNSISTDIKNTAYAIKKEEDAAAAAARAAALRQQKIRTAQINYDNAIHRCDELHRERESLERELSKKVTAKQKKEYIERLDELNQKIEEAERECNNCYNALSAARR